MGNPGRKGANSEGRGLSGVCCIDVTCGFILGTRTRTHGKQKHNVKLQVVTRLMARFRDYLTLTLLFSVAALEIMYVGGET